MQRSSRRHVGELEAEDDVCVQVGACSVQRVRTWLPWSDRKTAAGISVDIPGHAKFKPEKTFDLCGHVQSIFNYLFLFSDFTFSHLSVETDVRLVVSATSVIFDCKTKTFHTHWNMISQTLRADLRSKIHIPSHSLTQQEARRASPSFPGPFLSYRITSQHRSSQSETQTSSHLHGKILILEITKEGNGSKKSARWERDREREGRRR